MTHLFNPIVEWTRVYSERNRCRDLLTADVLLVGCGGVGKTWILERLGALHLALPLLEEPCVALQFQVGEDANIRLIIFVRTEYPIEESHHDIMRIHGSFNGIVFVAMDDADRTPNYLLETRLPNGTIVSPKVTAENRNVTLEMLCQPFVSVARQHFQQPEMQLTLIRQ